MTQQELKKYRKNREEVEQIKSKIQAIETMMIYPRIPAITGMPGGHGEPDKIGEIIAKAQDLRAMYQDKIIALLDEQKKIEEGISKLDSTQRRLLRLYYIDGMTWEQVACAMHYSWNTVHRIHRSSLIGLRKLS